MTFADKLKELRNGKNMSQEMLAEKLYVSRQAITKWETGAGLPDIENIVAISALFNESLDSLLSNEKSLFSKHEFLYESRTEYDLDEEKQIDVKIGAAREVIVERTCEEKIQILLASNRLNYLKQQAKVKIDECSRRMDVLVKHSPDFTDMSAKEDLFVFVRIPQRFVAHLELSGIIDTLRVRDIHLDNLEVGGKMKNGIFTNASGHIELDVWSDMTVDVDSFKGKIDFNQIHATSVLNVKSGSCYLRRVGTRNRFIDKNGAPIELAKSRRNDSTESEKIKEYDFIAEIAGFGSELKVCR